MNDRLRNLFLYLAQQMEEDNHAGRGRIKLSKLAWRCDFAAYWKLGESITGETYVVDRLGPKPESELDLTNEMIADKVFRWGDGFDQAKVPVALDDPDLSAFSAEQVAIIDAQLRECRNVSAQAMVAASHDFAGFKHAKPHGRTTEIPYQSVYWSSIDDDGLEDWEEQHAATLA